jgi:SAM-dependent methyltransferase
MAKDYSSVTEISGHKATQDQIDRAYSRYKFASEFTRDKVVLEVACGSGIGLKILGAKNVIHGDITFEFARGGVQLDGQRLPFRSGRFDVVLLFEAIYYFEDASLFAREAYRVLKPGGLLLTASANREWVDFNPSPQSTRYFSASELAELFSPYFQVENFGGFPAGRSGLKGVIKRTAVKMKLMPRTMKGKQLLKRVFVGKLKAFDLRSATYEKPVPLGAKTAHGYRVIYTLGRKIR